MDTENAGREFPGEYRLDVEDFGPIAKASVDLRPLTVFIGPSNTGKSYLAILVYVLHQCFGEGSLGAYAWRPRYYDQLLGLIYGPLREGEDDVPELLDAFYEWIQNETGDQFQPRLPIEMESESKSNLTVEPGDAQHALPGSVDTYIRSAFERAEGLKFFTKTEVGRCFGVDDLSTLVRRSSPDLGSRIRISIPRAGSTGTVKYDIRLEHGEVECSGTIGGAQSLTSEIEQLDFSKNLDLYLRRPPERGISRGEMGYALARVAENVFRLLINPLHRNAFYLPADRTGVMHSHQVVVSTLVQNAAAAGIHPSSNIPVLSGVLADFLSQLIGLSGEQVRGWNRSAHGHPQRSKKLASRIERDVLKGAVQMESAETGYPSFDFRPVGWSDPLPLMRASSMVSELAPVVLFLRHLVRPDDVLIIEEPESHLHPGMQVEFTRQLAGLVRAGIRVIVTTHSEWLLQELANLVRASALPEGKRAGIAGGDVALEPDQVGAWLFAPDRAGEGSTVSPIPLDEESGLYPTDFEEVARAMHNNWATISSRLGEAE